MRARITREAGGCVELEVLEVLGASSELSAGDTFGGVAQALCWNDTPLAGATEVLALFSPGQQASSECVEYRACSLQRRGRLEDAYSSSIDPECAARQRAGEPVDCQPIETVDEVAVVEWDSCNAGCLGETRDACASHEEEARLGGTVRMAPLTGDQLSFFWAGGGAASVSRSYPRRSARAAIPRSFRAMLSAASASVRRRARPVYRRSRRRRSPSCRSARRRAERPPCTVTPRSPNVRGAEPPSS